MRKQSGFWSKFAGIEDTQSCIKFEINSFLSLDDIWNYSSRIPDLRLVVIDPTEEIYIPVDFSAETIDWDTKKEPPSAIINPLKDK